MKYKVLLSKEQEGGYTVLVPALPGCITYGETVEEALKYAKEAIEGYLETLISKGEEIPEEASYIEASVEVEVNAKAPRAVS